MAEGVMEEAVMEEEPTVVAAPMAEAVTAAWAEEAMVAAPMAEAVTAAWAEEAMVAASSAEGRSWALA